MTDRLTRSFASDLELRGDGRTVVGIAVPFDQPTQIADGYTEVFRRGAFARTIAERGPAKVKLLANHDSRSFPIGRATVLREEANGLYIEARISATAAGDEALTLIRDGAVDSFSVGFSPVASGDRWDRAGTSVERLAVRLHEVSLTSFPAYSGATVSGLRSETYSARLDPALAAARLSILRNYAR